MIRVYTSNALEALAGALAETLPEPGDADGRALFEDSWLLTPSHTLGAFVELELARRRGIVSNLERLSLREAVTRLCASAHPDVTIIGAGHILGELLDLFEGLPPGGSPFARYLRAGGASPEAQDSQELQEVHDRRRVQLGGALAAAFDDWIESRPALGRAWRAGAAAPATGPRHGSDGPRQEHDGGDDATALESAEADLWQGLFGRGGRFEQRGRRTGRRFVPVDRIIEEGLARAWQPPRQIHLFAFSDIPESYFPILQALGALTQVTIYAFNPCREFWEDTDTARAARLAAIQPASARAAFARPGRGRGRGARGARPGPAPGQLELAGLGAAPPGSTEDLPVPSDSPFPPAPPPANPLLTLWGRATLPGLRALGQLVDGDFDPRFVEPSGRSRTGSASLSLLARLQRDVLDGRVPEGGARGDAHADDTTTAAAAAADKADASLRILGAPDPRRAWETIAGEIWAAVRADPHLRFCDIAVLLTGAGDPEDPYVVLGPTVLQEASGLPFTWVAPTLASTSAVGAALVQLLELFAGNFTRREVLDVLTHPNIQARVAGLASAAAAELWVSLCEALGVAQGPDRGAFADTYVTEDVFNWDQALRRLGLGVFAAGPRSGAESPMRIAEGPGGPLTAGAAPRAGLVPAEIPAGMRADVDTLALLLRSLLADAAFARGARLSFGEWAGWARAVLDAYVAPLGPDDDAARARILAELDALGEAVGAPEPRGGTDGGTEEAGERDSGLRLGLTAATALMREAMAGLRVARAQPFGGGVTVGTLRALRGIPFRVVFVAGLDAERFPAAERRNVFDPWGSMGEGRAPSGSPGISAPISPREADRSLFLEALLAARERLILTSVDRDPYTALPVLPSVVVLELAEVVAQHYGVRLLAPPGAPEGAGARRLPLHRDEDALARAAFPGARAEHRARAIGEAIRRAVPEAARLPGDVLLQALAPETRHLLAPHFSQIESLGPTPTEPSPDEEPPTAGQSGRTPPGTGAAPPLVLRLGDLVRFLQCPLQGSARFFLRLRDVGDEGEARDLEDEPVDMPRRVESSLLREAFSEALFQLGAASDAPSPEAAFTTLAAAYDRRAVRQRYANPRPTGLFGDHLRSRHLQQLGKWWAAVSAHLAWSDAKVRPQPRRICFGRPELQHLDLPIALAGSAEGERVGLELLPPLRLTLPSGALPAAGAAPSGRDAAAPIAIEIHGTTEPLLTLGDGSLALLHTSLGRQADAKIARQRVQALVEAVALVVGKRDQREQLEQQDMEEEMAGARLHSLHIDSGAPSPGGAKKSGKPGKSGKPASKPGKLVRIFHSPFTTVAAARAYLACLVGDLLAGVEPILFPCEAIELAMRSRLPLAEQIAFMRGDPFYRGSMSTGWGPVPDPWDYPIPDPITARALRRRRFEIAFGPEPAEGDPPGAGSAATDASDEVQPDA